MAVTERSKQLVSWPLAGQSKNYSLSGRVDVCLLSLNRSGGRGESQSRFLPCCKWFLSKYYTHSSLSAHAHLSIGPKTLHRCWSKSCCQKAIDSPYAWGQARRSATEPYSKVLLNRGTDAFQQQNHSPQNPQVLKHKSNSIAPRTHNNPRHASQGCKDDITTEKVERCKGPLQAQCREKTYPNIRGKPKIEILTL